MDIDKDMAREILRWFNVCQMEAGGDAKEWELAARIAQALMPEMAEYYATRAAEVKAEEAEYEEELAAAAHAADLRIRGDRRYG